MSDIDWSLAPEGATHGRKTYSGFDWYKIIDGNFCYLTSSRYWDSAVTAMSMCKIRPAKKEWNGEGRPPVGVPVEYQLRGASNGEWYPTQINFLSGQHVIYCDNDGDEVRNNPSEVKFRAIRTPEQIAADERLHQIRNALTTINKAIHLPSDAIRGYVVAATVEAMIDAGYRKFEITDDSDPA